MSKIQNVRKTTFRVSFAFSKEGKSREIRKCKSVLHRERTTKNNCKNNPKNSELTQNSERCCTIGFAMNKELIQKREELVCYEL